MLSLWALENRTGAIPAAIAGRIAHDRTGRALLRIASAAGRAFQEQGERAIERDRVAGRIEPAGVVLAA
jgi:hypothetical protein